ncbi:MAG: dicarboxylate/amino acid:cation symporter, partial [Bacteroidota bacterium]
LGRMGFKTLIAYLITTLFAVTLGLLVVNVWAPGNNASEQLRAENRISYELWRKDNAVVPLDTLCLSCRPAYAEAVERIQGKGDEQLNDWVIDKLDKADAQDELGPLQPLVDLVPSNIFRALGDTDMLQIIFFAILFGIALVAVPEEKRQPVHRLIDGLNDIFVRMVWLVLKAMPVFVFALMAGQIVKAAGNDPLKFVELLEFLLRYSGTVVLGLALMVVVVYPSVVWSLTNISWKRFLTSIRDAQITAFSTSSSVATLPVTMDNIEHKLGVSKTTTSFVLPIGATVNMDGTSLYQAVAVVAMAQFHMIDLSFGQQMVIVLTATVASIGAAAIPSAGLVLMIIVLESVGLNPAWIAIIFPVDRILDMCRTVVNVTGDATVATVVAQSEHQLEATPQNGLGTK